MADLLINRGADTLRKSFISQRRRDPAPLYRLIIHPFIYLFRCYPRPDMFRNIIEHRDIDGAALPDFFYLLRSLQKIACRYNVTFIRLRHKTFIEGLMAMFIFFSAAAPAGIISS